MALRLEVFYKGGVIGTGIERAHRDVDEWG